MKNKYGHGQYFLMFIPAKYRLYGLYKKIVKVLLISIIDYIFIKGNQLFYKTNKQKQTTQLTTLMLKGMKKTKQNNKPSEQMLEYSEIMATRGKSTTASF